MGTGADKEAEKEAATDIPPAPRFIHSNLSTLEEIAGAQQLEEAVRPAMLAFGTLAVLGCRAFPRRAVAVLCALLAYGGLIELLQSLTPYRSAEWADWLADGLGLLLGKVLVPVLARLGIR